MNVLKDLGRVCTETKTQSTPAIGKDGSEVSTGKYCFDTRVKSLPNAPCELIYSTGGLSALNQSSPYTSESDCNESGVDIVCTF